MANFFNKIKTTIKKETKENIEPLKSEEKNEVPAAEEKVIITREKAKEDLDKRIAEKLSKMSMTEDTFMLMMEKREREKEEFRQAVEEKRKKRMPDLRRETSFYDDDGEEEESKSDVIITENAVIAVYEETFDEKNSSGKNEEISQKEKEQQEVPLDNQIAMKDIPYITHRGISTHKVHPEEDKSEEFKSEELSPAAAFLNRIKEKVCNVKEKFVKDKPDVAKNIKRKYRRLWAKIKYCYRKIILKDKHITKMMVLLVDNIDEKNDALAENAAAVAKQGTKKFNLAREWAELNKKKFLIRFAACILVLLCCAGVYNFCTAYEYAYNGRTMGIVEDQEDVLRIVDLVSDALTSEHNALVKIDAKEDITFEKVFVIGKDVDDMSDVLNKMTYMTDLLAKGQGIYIEGKRVAIVDTEETAEEILDTVLASFTYQSDMTTYEEVRFAEEIEIKEVDTKLGRLENPGDVVTKILTGGQEISTHQVQSGETFSGIAKMYNLSTAELLAANPEVTPEKLSVGQEIVLTLPSALLTVQTVEVSTLYEVLPHETVYEENSSIYQGETSVKIAGQDGQRQVTAKIVKNNGIEVSRLELSSNIISSPVTEVIYMGTKALPPKQGTGTFIYPVTGARLTSKFGSRWGRIHYGIDLAIATGTKIRASDGGTVIFSGYSGSYGYVVKIDHGGGFVTVYAHCSKLHVKVGEKVYQGQHIANVGNTGRSTGPHCHFEIQYLGVQKNPLNYL